MHFSKRKLSKITDLINKAIDNQNLFYCDKIYDNNLTAFYQTGYPALDGVQNSADIKGLCQSYTIEKARKKELCDGIGTVYDICKGEKEYIDLCLSNGVYNLKAICYKNLAANTKNQEYCNFLRSNEEYYGCYNITNSSKQYYYLFLIKSREFLDVIVFWLAVLSTIFLPIFLLLTILLSYLFIKSIKNKTNYKSILTLIILIFFILLDLLEFYFLFINPPHAF